MSTIHGGSTRLTRTILAVIVASLVGIGASTQPAVAHPTLVSTLPEAGYSVAEPPEELGLVFDERVTVDELTLEGQARGDIRVTSPHISGDGTKIVIRPTEPLKDGRYTVRWQVTGEDGHEVEGRFGFGVGAVAAPNLDDLPAGRSAAIGVEATLRWLLVAALAVGLGGLVGDALTRRRESHRGSGPDHLAPAPWTPHAGAAGGLASLGLVVHSLAGGDRADGLGAALFASPADRVQVVQFAAFCVVTVAAAARKRWPAAAALVAVVVAEGWRSHLGGEAPPFGSIVIVVHLTAVAVWVGTLVHVLRVALRWRRSGGRTTALFIEYALLALGMYVVVVATGTIAAVLILPSVDALWQTTYGQIMLVKLALVAVASGLAVGAHRRLRRPHSAPAIVRLVRFEAPALVAVLAASAVLSSTAPPADADRQLAYPPPVRGMAVRLGTLAGQITTGVVVSHGQVELRLRQPEWDPMASHQFDVAATITHPDGGQQVLDLRPCGASCFVGPASWDDGRNRLDLDVGSADWDGGEVRFDVPWPAEDAEALFDRMLTTMTSEPSITFVETVSSDTTGPPGFRSDDLHTNGAELIDLQPYRSGTVSTPTVLRRDGELTEIGFAISAESIYVRQTLDPAGRIIEETLVSPNHLIERTYTYEPT